MAQLLKKMLIIVFSFASDHYPETLVLALVAILSNFFARTYIIFDFRYDLTLLLAMTGILSYHAFRKFFPRRRMQLLALGVVFIAVCLILIVFKSEFHNLIYSRYIRNFLLINEQIGQNLPTRFSDYLPFIYFLTPLSFLLLFVLYGISASAALAIIFGCVLLISSGGLDYYLQPYNAAILWLLISYSIVAAYLAFFPGEQLRLPRYIVVYSAGISLSVVIGAHIMIGLFGSSSFVDRLSPLRNSIYSHVARLSGKRATGFSDNDMALGGELYPDEGIAFIVEAENLGYLRGKVRALYDGSRWSSRGAFHTFDSPDESAFPPTVRWIRVIPRGISTSYYFTMPQTIAIRSRVPVSTDNEYNYRQSDENRIRKPYTVWYDESAHSENFSLQLYPGLPDRVRNIAAEICQTAHADTDQKKISAISDYLKQNFHYSLSSPVAKDGHDYVDQFLFVSKKGYCTAFASAAVILLRCAGVPANYVEGFHISGTRDKNGRYAVTNRMAHAWCETEYGIVDAANTAYEPNTPEYGTPVTIPGIMRSFGPFTGAPAAENKISLPFELENFLPSSAVRITFYILVNLLPILLLGFILGIIIKVLWFHFFLFAPESLVPLFRHIRKKLVRYGVSENPSRTALEWLDEVYIYEIKQPLRTLIHALYQETYANRSIKINRRKIYRSIIHELSYLRKWWMFWQ